MRILIVDDERSLLMTLAANLELEGFDVAEAATVHDADASVRDQRPDVVLLDVHLGGVASHDLLARLRAEGLPVALVTGSVDVEEYRTSADAVVAKPFVPQELVEIARRLARVGT